MGVGNPHPNPLPEGEGTRREKGSEGRREQKKEGAEVVR